MSAQKGHIADKPVLVVEDNPANLKLIRDLLELLECRVLEADRAEDAITMIEDQEVSLVLMDILLPGMNGFEVLEKVKELKRHGTVQTVVTTCLDDMQNKVRGIEPGADDYIIKPVNVRELKFRLKALLRNKENALLSSLREKELLLKEIHHRVKNNLQAIAGLLETHLAAVEPPRDREVFLKGQSFAMAMSMIHELLYDTDDFSRINFADYTRELVDNSLQLYADNNSGIDIVINIDRIFLNADTAIPVSLIISELVSNALTHAYPDGRNGTITVSMKQVGRGGFLLEVADDGTGLPEDERTGDRTTPGLELVRSLTDNLHGSMSIKVDKGTTFILRLKEYYECENLELG